METRMTQKVVSVTKEALVRQIEDYGERGEYDLAEIRVSATAVHFHLKRKPPKPKPESEPEPVAEEDDEEIPI